METDDERLWSLKIRSRTSARELSGYVERGEIPGIAAAVSRHGDVHVETLGTLGFDRPAEVRRDTMFRIASLTKLVTAVGAMCLVEDCRIRLDQSIEEWLPELANRRVLKSIAASLDETVPAERSITVRDLLTFRMGFGSVMAPQDTFPIQRSIRELRIGGDGFPLPTKTPPTDQWLSNLASLPLIAQPGERWMYNTSADVLGVLVERVSGQSLGTFMREQIFDPLGMVDTSFRASAEQIGRMGPLYSFNHQTNAIDVFDGDTNSAWRDPPPMESGAGGLLSTIDDYLAFCQMLLNNGRLGNERILSPATVTLMTSDQTTPAQRTDAGIFFGSHSSWGLGVAVDIGRSEIFHRPGRFGWTGGYGTAAYIDPQQGMITILFTQRTMDSPAAPAVYSDFWTLACAAIE